MAAVKNFYTCLKKKKKKLSYTIYLILDLGYETKDQHYQFEQSQVIFSQDPPTDILRRVFFKVPKHQTNSYSLFSQTIFNIFFFYRMPGNHIDAENW